MAKSEGFQLPLLIEMGGQPAEDYTASPSPYTEEELVDHTDTPGRFVRTVNEEITIRSPEDAAHHLIDHVYTPFEQIDQEELWVLLLNTKNRVTHEAMIYRGTLNTVYIRLAELFKEAIRVNAAAFILSHCHPSGEPAPSPVIWRKSQVAKLLLGISPPLSFER